MTEPQRLALFNAAREAILDTLPQVWAIYVYGSAARGDDWPDSDIDLALLLPPAQRIPDYLGLSATLSARLGRTVDLVDLRQAGSVLHRQVLQEGRQLHVADVGAVLEWEARALTESCDHRARIGVLLEDFRRSGVGYAP